MDFELLAPVLESERPVGTSRSINPEVDGAAGPPSCRPGSPEEAIVNEPRSS
jgi:hypothetical protein